MSPFDDKEYSAKEWSRGKRIPYRLILDAVKRGDLEAWNPSGVPGGKVMISESAFADWKRRNKVKVNVPGRVGRGNAASGRSLDELVLK